MLDLKLVIEGNKVGCEITAAKIHEGVGYLQVKTHRTGKLWVVTYDVFAERLKNGTFITESSKEINKLEDLVGVTFKVKTDNINPF